MRTVIEILDDASEVAGTTSYTRQDVLRAMEFLHREQVDAEQTELLKNIARSLERIAEMQEIG